MKKYKPVIFLGGAVICCLLLATCNKLTDFLRHHPDAEIRNCQIQTWSTTGFLSGEHFEASFEYNSWGDPVFIRVANVGTGNPHREFKYDQQHRLTQYLGVYETGCCEFEQRLAYGDSGEVIRDTVLLFQLADSHVNFYEYDNSKRIRKITRTFPFGGSNEPEFEEYNYDTKGNLIRPGIVYDNKINIQRTNKVWMFLNRDYSINNPFLADTYNKNGLPTKLTSVAINFLHFPFFDETLVTYSCK